MKSLTLTDRGEGRARPDRRACRGLQCQFGEVTTDWYGNPLCTTYRPTTVPGRFGYELDAEGHPIVLTRGGQCTSDLARHGCHDPQPQPDRWRR